MNNIVTPEKLNNLPLWARKHVAQLQHERDAARGNLKRLLDYRTESNVYIKDHTLNIGSKLYLQTRSVSFILSQGEIQVSLEGQDSIALMGFGSGPCTQLCILPSVTFVARVMLSDR